MKKVVEVLVGPMAVQIGFAAEVETWLQTQVELEAEVWWRRHGFTRPVVVRNAVELASRVAELASLGEWGVLDREPSGPWAQTMRVIGGFIVEVHTGQPDGWVQRVFPIGGLGIDGPRTITRNQEEGLLGASHLDGEAIGSATGATQVLWAWLHGGLPAGYELRDVRGGVD